MVTATVALTVLSVTFTPFCASAQPILPDDGLTPGIIADDDVQTVCTPKYAKRPRHTTAANKRAALQRYGLKATAGHFQIDHRVPLAIGGADVLANLWPQSYTVTSWNARAKDRLEDRVHKLVCAGLMPLTEAQRLFLGDWTVAYRLIVGEP